MKAIWLEDGQVKVRTDLPVPEPAEGEALIQVRLAGICHTDLELVRGYYPFRGVLGHEFVGSVVEADGAPELRGRRVVGEINAVCGQCPRCRAGRSNHCAQRTVLGIAGRNGAFADYLVLPAANLHPVPETVSDSAAVFTEPLAAACRILEQVPVAPADRVLVMGAGKLGQLIARVLALTCAEVNVLARYSHQEALLAQAGLEGVRLHSAASDFDLVVEATGNPAGLRQALSLVRPGGTLVLKSTYHGTAELDVSRLVVDEIRLIGSRCGPFPPALRLLADHRVDPAPLIDTIVPLEAGPEFLQPGRRPGRGKVLLSIAG